MMRPIPRTGVALIGALAAAGLVLVSTAAAGGGSSPTVKKALPSKVGSKAPAPVGRFGPTNRPFGGSHTGRPFGAIGTGRPVAPLGSGRPLAPVGTGRPFGEVGTGRPFGAVGTGRPFGAVGTGRPFGAVGTERPFGTIGSSAAVSPVPGGSNRGDPVDVVIPPETSVLIGGRGLPVDPGVVVEPLGPPGSRGPSGASGREPDGYWRGELPENGWGQVELPGAARPHPMAGVAEQLVITARGQLRNGQVYLAEASLSSAVTLFPEDSRLRLEYALALAGVGNIDGAARQLVDGFRLYPDLVVEPLNVIDAYGGRELYDERFATVDRYQKAFPLESSALFVRGFLAMHSGASEKALVDFESLGTSDPDFPFVRAFLKRLEAADVAPRPAAEEPESPEEPAGEPAGESQS